MMISQNTNTNNNNNNNNNKDEETTELEYKFRIQKEKYQNEKTYTGDSWPYNKSTEERQYEEWLAQVRDPVTGEFYKSKDNPPKSMRRVINGITRFKLNDGSEKLYSQGRYIGYNSFGDRITTPDHAPQIIQVTIFGHKTGVDKNNRLRRETTGPIGIENIYTTEFNEENLDKLYNQRDGNQIFFYVQREDTRKLVLVQLNSGNVQQTYNLFKNCDFDTLFYAKYDKDMEPVRSEIISDNDEDSLIKKAEPDNQTKPNDSRDPKKVK